ncbi:M10 family metallopeptidase C-terminal domain-containing protein, partial [Ruegeria sp. HKCCC2117]
MSGVTSAFNSFGVGNLNQGVYTVMSYNDGWTSQNGGLRLTATYGGSTGLGAFDIAALQAMYGANTTYNSGDNTFVLPYANFAGTGYQAIWDTGGNDTIQHVGSSDSWIDLRPATLDYSDTGGGVVSHATGVRGGFTIAHGVVIENASGGSGADVIVGNTAQNTLWGNAGHDRIYSVSDGTNNNTIYGGLGNDTIYLAMGSGADQVFGNEGNDTAVVTRNGGTFTGGTGTDTVRFVSAISTYLFIDNGSTYEFLDVVSRVSFTIANDVELVQFLDGVQQYTRAGIQTAMQLTDIDNQGTTLKHAAQGLYVVDSGGSNLGLIYNGQAVGAASFAGWQAIQAEASGGDYRVLWKNSDGTYLEWVVDSSGQFKGSNSVGNVVSLETFYNADLNNDGTIGHTSTNIESNGSTTLGSTTQNVYLINGTIELALGDGTTVGPNSIAGWQAIQAEAASGGGYTVLWQSTGGVYGEWIVDASGRLQSSSVIDDVRDVEANYGVDLNSDGQIGHFTTNIESNGSTTLGYSTRGVYVIGGSIDLTDADDALVGPSSIAGWQAIQAEAASGGGYRVLWQSAGGVYGEWTVDASGRLQSSSVIDDVRDVEANYGVDLNSDGQIGHFTTNIESNGSTTLGYSTRGVYVIGGSIDLTDADDALVGPNSIAGWQAIQAEAASGGGYRVLWQSAGGVYGEWTVDASG